MYESEDSDNSVLTADAFAETMVAPSYGSSAEVLVLSSCFACVLLAAFHRHHPRCDLDTLYILSDLHLALCLSDRVLICCHPLQVEAAFENMATQQATPDGEIVTISPTLWRGQSPPFRLHVSTFIFVAHSKYNLAVFTPILCTDARAHVPMLSSNMCSVCLCVTWTRQSRTSSP